MSHVLVLNAGFEPLCIVPEKRAVVLVLAGKAETITASGRVLRSARCSVAAPTVVRLGRFVRAPSPAAMTPSRRLVLARDRHRCQYCGAGADTVDHVLPRSRGGGHSWENLVACCRRCNHVKGSRTPTELGWTLTTRPRPPAPHLRVMLGAANVRDDWHVFLPA